MNLPAKVTAKTRLKTEPLTDCARRKTFRSECCLVLEHWLLRHIDLDRKMMENDLDLSDVFNVSTVIHCDIMELWVNAPGEHQGASDSQRSSSEADLGSWRSSDVLAVPGDIVK